MFQNSNLRGGRPLVDLVDRRTAIGTVGGDGQRLAQGVDVSAGAVEKSLSLSLVEVSCAVEVDAAAMESGLESPSSRSVKWTLTQSMRSKSGDADLELWLDMAE
jgi:hypothetical protein